MNEIAPSPATHILITTDTGNPIVSEDQILLQRISDDQLQSFQLTKEIMRAFNLIVNLVDTNTSGENGTPATPLASVSRNIEKNDTSEPELGLKWTQQQTLLLIRLVESNYEKFNEGLKKNVWLKIAKALSDMTNKKFTAEQCDTKWKGLKRTYKTIKDHNNKSGNDRRIWEFFAAIDSFLSKKPEIEPLSICSTITNKLELRVDPSTAEESTSSNEAVCAVPMLAVTPRGTPAKKRKQCGGVVEHQTGQTISDDSD
ncbi:unnamed protein product [Ceutorhynchus assimilis]|uniref:Myb-like domain-containing protein n=1 Tax=Ceutorhynchus assimilis TaxID=467358 RepID=A0A9N9N1T7_9CUCU|nr:unnamed protein product [Ceutorhynchus assimilis]